MDEIYSHLGGSPERQKRLSSVSLPLPMACNCIPAPIEEMYPVSGLDVDFADKKQGEQLNGLVTREGLQRMMEGKNYSATDTLFPFVAGSV